MFETSPEARVSDTLFGPIEDRNGAEDLATLLAFVVLALAVVEAGLTIVVGPAALAVAVAEAVLGGLVGWRKSKGAAVALLGVALAAAGAMLAAVVGGGGSGYAWAFPVALVGVWAGDRAVACATFRHFAPKPDLTAGIGG